MVLSSLEGWGKWLVASSCNLNTLHWLLNYSFWHEATIIVLYFVLEVSLQFVCILVQKSIVFAMPFWFLCAYNFFYLVFFKHCPCLVVNFLPVILDLLLLPVYYYIHSLIQSMDTISINYSSSKLSSLSPNLFNKSLPSLTFCLQLSMPPVCILCRIRQSRTSLKKPLLIFI